MKHKYTHYSFLLLGFILAISTVACKPGPVLQWSKTFDGGIIDSIQQTKDGGYILCGIKPFYETPHDSGAWLIKTDADGNKVWDKTFSRDVADFPWSARQTTDGGYIICGDTLIKTDGNGDKLWEKVFNDVRGNSIQQTIDSGYIICGESDRGLKLLKTDAEGNIIWDKTFVDSEDVGSEYRGNSVQQTIDGGYIVCGITWPLQHLKGLQDSGYISNSNVWLIKTDAEGNKVWDKTFSGKVYAEGYSVQQTLDGGYIICGTGDNGRNWKTLNVLLIRTDANGNRLWEKVFDRGHGSSVQLTTDGGYIICGTADLYISGLIEGLPRHCWLIKTDADGNKLWDKTFGEGITYCRSVQQTADGGYITCGQMHNSNSALLFKIASFP